MHVVRRLTVPIALLLGVAGLGGIGTDLYAAESGFVRPQLVAQDVFNLAVALPLLLASAPGARRGRPPASFLWLGTVGFLAYNYATYALGVRHNAMFLPYVALFSLATSGLVAGALSLPAERLVEAGRAVPARAIGLFLVAVGGLFALVWLVDIVLSLIAGRVPSVVERYDVPTFSVYVIDLGFALPALVLGGRALWRREVAGYRLAGVMLPLTALMMAQLAFVNAWYGFVSGILDVGMLALFGTVGLASAAVTARFLVATASPSAAAR